MFMGSWVGFRFKNREDVGNLFVGADDTDGVAGEEAGVARRDGHGLGATLNHNNINAIASAQVAVAQAFPHKRAAVANRDVS